MLLIGPRLWMNSDSSEDGAADSQETTRPNDQQAAETFGRSLLETALFSQDGELGEILFAIEASQTAWNFTGVLKPENRSSFNKPVHGRVEKVCSDAGSRACWRLAELVVDGTQRELAHVASGNRTNPSLSSQQKTPSELPEKNIQWRIAKSRIDGRAGPGPEYETILRVPSDAALTLLTRANNWGWFNVRGKAGKSTQVWIPMASVTSSGKAAAVPAPKPGMGKRVVRTLAPRRTGAYGARRLTYDLGALSDPVAMQLVRGVHPVVKVLVNGERTLNFLVDTGASVTFVSKETFRISGHSKSANLKSLCFENGVCFEDVAVKPNYSNYTDPRAGYYNGLLGIDLLRNTGLTIDYRNNRIFLGEAPDYSAATKVRKLDFYMDKSRRPFTAISIGIAVFPKILLDTGSSFTRVTPLMVSEIKRTPQVKYREMSFTAEDIEMTEISTLSEVCLNGEICLPKVLGQTASWPAVGGTFFRNFRTTFNFQTNRLTLRPEDKWSTPPLSLMQRFGFQIHIGDATQIVLVEPGSIADRAGVSIDDRLTQVGGASVAELGYLGVHKILEDPRTTTAVLTLENVKGVSRIVRLRR